MNLLVEHGEAQAHGSRCWSNVRFYNKTATCLLADSRVSPRRVASDPKLRSVAEVFVNLDFTVAAHRAGGYRGGGRTRWYQYHSSGCRATDSVSCFTIGACVKRWCQYWNMKLFLKFGKALTPVEIISRIANVV